MKVLITGASGFAGTHLVNILKRDHKIIAVDRQKSKLDQKEVIFETADILDKNLVYKILEKHKPEVIVHLAGIAKTWGNTAEEVFKVNFFGTLNLFESAVELKEKAKFNPKIIYVSSAEVYGHVENPEKISEDYILNPLNSYAVSKIATDRLSYQMCQTHGLKILILRPFPHTGPGQKKGFFVPDMASQIVEAENSDKNEILVGNLEGIRDYLDVRDVCLVYKYFVENEFIPGDVFNICSGKGVRIKDLLNILLKLSNKSIGLKVDPSRLRPQDNPVYIGSNEKLKSFSSWSPKYEIEQTLKETLEYWRQLWKDKE